jgi:hypothetical protein
MQRRYAEKRYKSLAKAMAALREHTLRAREQEARRQQRQQQQQQQAEAGGGVVVADLKRYWKAYRSRGRQFELAR